MTTSLPHTHVRLRDLSELVAGIPYVLGFPPTDSLVLFTFRRCPVLALSTTIRVDLPKPEHIQLVVADLVAAVSRNEAVAAIAVVVGDPAPEHQRLVETLRMALADNNILLTHASWVRKVVHGEQWQCFDDPLCTGTVPDPETSALAAAIAVAGDTTYPNREAVAAHLAPDSEEALARRKELLKALREQPAQPYGEPELEADLTTLGHALDKAMTSYDMPALNDHQLVRLALAMSRTPIKDECLAIALTDEPDPPERLWTALVRSLPAPDRAEPAFLLAMSAYLRGAGVLAALALKIARESNPHHELAASLDGALQLGVPPNVLRAMLITSVINNKEENTNPTPLDDDPPWDTTPESPTRPTAPEPPNPATPPAVSETPPPEAFPPGESVAVDRVPAGYPACGSVSPENPPDDRDLSYRPEPFAGTSIADTVWAATDEETPGTPESATAADPMNGFASSAVKVDAAPGDGPMSAPHHPARTAATAPTLTAPMVDEQVLITREGSPLPTTDASSLALAVDGTVAGSERRVAPGALGQRAAAVLGIPAGSPERHVAVMDALTAFLPPPTERSGPG